MENVGISLQKFFADPDVDQVLGRNRVGFVFDMAVQILNALRILHQGGFAHIDIKPDNICVTQADDSTFKTKKYKFTLIDFGLIKKIKISKACLRRRGFRGNLLFASWAGLLCEQIRPQDDIESLLYIMHWCLNKMTLPWKIKAESYINQVFRQRQHKTEDLKEIYRSFLREDRITNYRTYVDEIT